MDQLVGPTIYRYFFVGGGGGEFGLGPTLGKKFD